MTHRPWQEKFRELLAAMRPKARPLVVQPKRPSGPRILPERWHEPEVNELLPKGAA